MEDIEAEQKRLKEIRRGVILHLALSFVKERKELLHPQTSISRALIIKGEKPENWDVGNDFEAPIKRLYQLEGIERFFPEKISDECRILTEREFIFVDESGKSRFSLLRPDRVVVRKDGIIVVDFKSRKTDRFLNRQKSQVESYKELLSRVFELPVEGYLLFILDEEVVKV